jgi:diketogulonate reductase-like aldo/keto reductase
MTMQINQLARGPLASRRDLMRGLGLGLAAAAIPGGLLLGGGSAPVFAQQAADGLLRRTIPNTDEAVPAIGLGTFLTFDVIPGEKRDHLREVMRRMWEGGARLVDTSPLYGMGEVNVGDFATSLGINGEMFVANKIWSTGEFLADESHARQSLDQSMQRLWRSRMDVMQCHSLVNVDIAVPLMRAWKKEGLVRYVGVTHHETGYFDLLAHWIERGNIDFVQLRYSMLTRQAEERVLKLAADRGVAVLVNMPFEKARLFQLVGERKVPEFAQDAGIESWAHYFLKWVLANPAITCVIPATSVPEHAAENVAAMRGDLPDAALRQRMLRHMQEMPGFDALEKTPWYPGKRYPGVIARAQGALRARS